MGKKNIREIWIRIIEEEEIQNWEYLMNSMSFEFTRICVRSSVTANSVKHF